MEFEPVEFDPGIEIDWWAYYHQFCEVHGEPIIDGGRLLFQDGWQYALEDPAGPEWPPPKDQHELRSLQLRYWRTRRDLVVDRLRMYRHWFRNIEGLTDARDQPIMIRAGAESMELDLEQLKAELRELEGERLVCSRQIGAMTKKENINEG